MISKLKGVSTLEKRFVSEVQPTLKVAYVSVKEVTKSWVSFIPNRL
jgi:hypothetical protein